MKIASLYAKQQQYHDAVEYYDQVARASSKGSDLQVIIIIIQSLI